MQRTDAELVQAVRDGEKEAFGILVDRYRVQVVAAAHHLVRNYEAAQDVAQEAFVDAYRRLKRLREPEKFKSWLHGIVHKKCLKHLQRESRLQTVSLDELREELDDSELDWQAWEAVSSSDDTEGQLVSLLNELPLPYRQILAAKYLQEMSYQEIAEMTGMTVNHVRVLCCRAKQRLRKLFEASDRNQKSEIRNQKSDVAGEMIAHGRNANAL